MEILLTTTIDTAMVIGLTAAFLFADIAIRHNLKMDLSDVGSDLAIGAFSVQISVIAALLTGKVTPDIANDSVLLVLFGSLWATSMWQTSRQRSSGHMISFIMGTTIFTLAAAHLLRLHEPSTLGLLVALAVALGYIGAVITKNLYNESIVRKFDQMLGKVSAYDMLEVSAKKNLRNVDDPLYPAVDSIRCAIRNNDEDRYTTGLRKITTISQNLMTGSKETTDISSHVNAHLLEMGLIALEKESNATKEIISSIGSIGTSAAKHGSQAGAVSSIATIGSLFAAAKRNNTTGLQRYFVETTGAITQTAAGYKQETTVEKGLVVFKEIAEHAAFSGDPAIMTAVKEELVELARIAANKEQTTYIRSIVLTMRDIGTRILRLEGNERQKAFKELMDSFRRMGKFMSGRDLLETTWAMTDLAIGASRENLENETLRSIKEIEEIGITALKGSSDGKTDSMADEIVSQVIISLKEICISSMRSELTAAVSAVGTAFAGLDKYDEAAILVQDSVMDIAEYRTGEEKLYRIFLEKYGEKS
ncbi:hypothetical protein [Methanococcoides sp. FTZ1]|uniref:hypothetical protein n=1 Tax=Methanococcoides sp. FTZ1 TaxID=3439061 RepID=UPI003F845288